MHVPLVTRERRETVEFRDRRVVGCELAASELGVLLDLVELAQRDRSEDV